MAAFILDQAESLANSNAELRPHLRSVAKEIIHHHILRAMNDSRLLQSLTFIGGTCLRLCHGGIRFSEDLDFRGGGQDFESLNEAMSQVLEPALLKRGLKATVRQAGEPDKARLKPVRRWWVRVQVRDEQQRGAFSVERIKLDIDSRPKPETRECLPLIDRFGGLAGDLSEGALIPCLPMIDICADKLEALPLSIARRPDNPRYRDIFDLAWAMPKLDGSILVERAKESATQRQTAEATRKAISQSLPQLHGIVQSERCHQAMVKFLTKSVADRTVSSPDYRSYMATALVQRLEELERSLGQGHPANPNHGGNEGDHT